METQQHWTQSILPNQGQTHADQVAHGQSFEFDHNAVQFADVNPAFSNSFLHELKKQEELENMAQELERSQTIGTAETKPQPFLKSQDEMFEFQSKDVED